MDITVKMARFQIKQSVLIGNTTLRMGLDCKKPTRFFFTSNVELDFNCRCLIVVKQRALRQKKNFH